MSEEKLPNQSPSASPAQEGGKSPLASTIDQKRRQAEDFFAFYANNISVGFSTWDMSITFGEIMGQDDAGQPIVEEIGKVTMTREFFKVFTQLLAINVRAYEERFGEIKSPHFDLTPSKLAVDFEKLESGSGSPSASPSPSSSASPSA